MMHERSVFRTPPDFTVLAEKYFDFSQHVTYNTLGKAKLDFKDADSQRALSKTLLKHFFELDVRLPQGRLVPAVPQRLNYLLWVQDLVEKVLERKDNVVALDVGEWDGLDRPSCARPPADDIVDTYASCTM